MRRVLLTAALWLIMVLPAAAQSQTVLTSTLTLTSANNGQTFNNYRISTTSGPCVKINGASNITISASNIGPCGGAAGSTNISDSNGVEIVGASSNNAVYDSYIHPETFCTPSGGGSEDQHDGILDNGTGTGNIFQGNVIAYGDRNIVLQSSGNTGDQVLGNFLLNPHSVPTCAGAGAEQGNQIRFASPVTVSNNFAIACRTSGGDLGNTGINCSDIPNFASANVAYDDNSADLMSSNGGASATNSIISNNYILGGGLITSSDCYLIFSPGNRPFTFNNNIGVDCGEAHTAMMDVDTGTGTISNLKLFSNVTGPPINQVSLAMGVSGSLSGSPAWALTNDLGNMMDNRPASNGFSCGDSYCTNGTVTQSGNTFGAGAFPSLGYTSTLPQVLAAVGTPPLIPPSPKSCVVASPFSTQTSLPSCNSTPVKVQDCSTTILSAGGALTASCTLPGVRQGDTIVVCPHNGSGTVLVTDNNGATYTSILGNAIQMSTNHAGGTVTITEPNTSVGTFQNVTAAEYSGLGIMPTFDGAGANSTYAARTTISPGASITTSGANPELLVGCGFVDSVQTPSSLVNTGGGMPQGYTNQGQTASSGGETNVGAWQIATAAGPFAMQWTVTSANTFGAMAAIKPSAAATNTCQALGPGGPGGICDYCRTTVANLPFLAVTPGSTCLVPVTDATACVPGSQPTGGGSLSCTLCWNGTTGPAC